MPPRIDPKLFERLQQKLGVRDSQLYSLIDSMSRKMGIPRHLAAVALGASRNVNISRWATNEYYAAIRGATAGHAPPAPPMTPTPSRSSAHKRPSKAKPARKPGRVVFVVYGRDEALRESIFDFLRALHLQPIEWPKARAMTKKPNPVISDILDVAFAKAAAVVVVLSPDDEAKLADHFVRPSDPPHEKVATGQPRPNVLWEGGMAWARSPDRTVLVQVGRVRPFSDIAGHHILHLTDAAEDRKEFVARLRDAKCDVDTDGSDWLSKGKFVTAAAARAEKAPKAKKTRRRRDRASGRWLRA